MSRKPFGQKHLRSFVLLATRSKSGREAIQLRERGGLAKYSAARRKSL
jgi:hypothetical protein